MTWPANYGRLWGQIPNTAGRVFWVAPSASYTVNGRACTASDGQDGLAPDRALLTINRAWTQVTADAGDVIVLLPGTHTPSASIAANVAGVTMMGLPSGQGNPISRKVTIAAVAGDETINITASRVELAYFNVIPTTAFAAIDINVGVGGVASNQVNIHDVTFDLFTPAANTATVGITALDVCSYLNIERCYFNSDGAQGNAIVATGSKDSIIQDCVFSLSAGTWASVILCGAATDRLLIRRNTFQCAGTAITAGVNGTGATLATGVACHDNRFSSLCTVPIDNFDASECEIVENYSMSVGAGAGGVLITAIT